MSKKNDPNMRAMKASAWIKMTSDFNIEYEEKWEATTNEMGKLEGQSFQNNDMMEPEDDEEIEENVPDEPQDERVDEGNEGRRLRDRIANSF